MFDRLFPRRASGKPQICVVSHDAYRHGAQMLSLEMAEILAETFDVHIVVLGPGPLIGQFKQWGHVHRLEQQNGDQAKQLAAELARSGVHAAICNSVASGLFVEPLAAAGVRCVALAHELPGIIRDRNLSPHVAAIRAHATRIVFPSESVRDQFPGGAPASAVVLPQGLSKRAGPPNAAVRMRARKLLAEKHKTPEDAPIVLNVAYGDLRKGVDLFVAIGAALMTQRNDVRMLWVGDIEPAQKAAITDAVGGSPHPGHFIFAPFSDDLSTYYASADVFALTSREDPFPTVLLQAMDAGLPAIAFKDAGGFEQALTSGITYIANSDVPAFAAAIAHLLNDPSERQAQGHAALAAVANRFDLREYVATLVRLAEDHASTASPTLS